MITRIGRTWTRPLRSIWLPASLSTVLLASAAAGQVADPVPPSVEPAPGDSASGPIPPEQVSGDTIPASEQSSAGSIARAAGIPDFPPPAPAGWSSARWTWTRDQLSRLPGMTVLEFIERLPGFVAFRAGGFGRPEALTAIGMAGGRVRLIVDGYEVDPHDATSYPVGTLSVMDVSRLTIERSISDILVDVVTFRQEDADPYSVVQIGTGVFETRFLRALVSRGVGSRSVATGAFDLTNTNGIGIAESYATNSTKLRWSYATSENSGIEADIRRTAVDRDGGEFPLEMTRTDVVLRGRATIGERVVVEGYGGRSDANDDVTDGESLLSEVQAGARAAYASERIYLRGAIRGRTEGGPSLPAAPFEFDASAVLRPNRVLSLEALSTVQSGNGSAASSRLIAGISPHPAITLFGSGEFGTRLYPFRFELEPLDSAVAPGAEFRLQSASVSGYRAGLQVAVASATAGIAALRSGTTPAFPFGFSFDLPATPIDAPALNGVEMYFDIPLIPGYPALRLDGWYNRWFDTVSRPYTPADMGRFGLTFHDLFIDSQLEPFARLELVRQGPASMPLAPPSGAGQTMPTFTTMNFDLRIRILSVQAFLIWDNILTAQRSLPLVIGPTPQPRIVYGISWQFRN